ncbi:MAG: F0F1 ATP synthase subunit gamma [Acidobacteriaceae bacterium]
MANILELRRRIRSTKNTRQITKAMQMVSAAKLRRAQERALAARPYAEMLTNVLKSLVSRVDIFDPVTGEHIHPLLVRREEKNVLLIVVSGEKGLAGAFNSNILKNASLFIARTPDKTIDIVSVGRKSRDYFRKRYQFCPAALEKQLGEEPSSPERKGQIQVIDEHVGVIGKNTFAAAREIANEVVQAYRRGEIDSVYIVFNEFKSVIAQRLVVEEVLPIVKLGERDIHQSVEPGQEERKRAIEAAQHAGADVRALDTSAVDAMAATFGAADGVDYIYEQKPSVLMRDLLPKFVAVQLYRSMLESEAAEHAARMTAMDSATNNASDMIDSLTLAMNRARQAKITTEIIEIVSGAAAL